jgi:hypothetical protein
MLVRNILTTYSRLCLGRGLIDISVLTGGTEKGPSVSYPLQCGLRRFCQILLTGYMATDEIAKSVPFAENVQVWSCKMDRRSEGKIRNE